MSITETYALLTKWIEENEGGTDGMVHIQLTWNDEQQLWFWSAEWDDDGDVSEIAGHIKDGVVECTQS